MPECSRITRPHTSVAVAAPDNRDADGYDRPVTGLRRQALLTAAEPGVSRRARRSDERITAAYPLSVIGSLMTIHIWFERVSRRARTPLSGGQTMRDAHA